jgi:hypothetical protein
MAAIVARYVGALERTRAEAKSAHENGAKQRADTVTENFARLTKAANDLAAEKGAQHDQAAADKQAADAFAAAKTAHDGVCDDCTDSQQDSASWTAETDQRAAKCQGSQRDAITQVTNSEDHRRDLAAMGKVVFADQAAPHQEWVP